MIRIFFTTCVLLCSIGAYSQDTIRVYLDDNYASVEPGKSTIVRNVVVKDGRYSVWDQYRDGRFIMYGEYSSINPWIENGFFRYYTPSGALYASGQMENGFLNGPWTYQDGKGTDTADYSPALDYFNAHRIFTTVQSSPVNGWVDPALVEFLRSRLHYPPRAAQVTGQSSAYVSVIHDRKGMVQFNVSDTKHQDLDFEVYRILLQTPDSLLAGIGKSRNGNTYEFMIGFEDSPTSTHEPGNRQEPVDGPYIYVDQGASFHGGDIRTFREWAQRNMIYPPVAVENGEQGRVTISFTVMKDGTVNDIKILGSSGSKALDREAVRVVSSSPLWEPARQNNEIVTQVFVIPLIFMLQ